MLLMICTATYLTESPVIVLFQKGTSARAFLSFAVRDLPLNPKQVNIRVDTHYASQ